MASPNSKKLRGSKQLPNTRDKPRTEKLAPQSDTLSINVTIDDILNAVKEAPNIGEKSDWESILSSQHISAIRKIANVKRKNDPQDPNILHKLAEKTSDFSKHYRQFGEWLVKENPYSNLLVMKSKLNNDFTPFHLALGQKNDGFVKAVLDKCPPQKLTAILKPEKPELNQQNCLHLAIEAGSPYIFKIIEEIQKCRDSQAICKQGDKEETKNTPLHYAVIRLHDDDRQVDNQKDVVRRLIKAFDKALLEPNKAGDTPYQARIKVLRDHHQENLFSELGEENDDEDYEPSSDESNEDSDGEDYTAESEANQGWSYAGSDRLESEDEGQDGTDHDVTEEEISWEEDPDFRKRVVDDPILSLIRDYCIREFERAEVTTALYHATQERETYFNLSGRTELSITRAYLDKLARHLKFESILTYVALPKLTMESPGVPAYHNGSDVLKGLRHMEEIFQWLHENGVKQILTVIIIDNVEPSHSDVAIENSLKGFNVEVWDWKKLDLNCDVIANSTEGAVREISLYCSGNNAVLMGWSSKEGLRSKEKFPKLKQVHLYYREGLEDETRLDQYVQTFTGLLTAHTNALGESVEVTTTKDDKNNSYMDGFRARGGNGPSSRWRNRWLDEMKPFLQIVFNIPDKEAGFVKIAVIDNGVDASLDILDGKIKAGASFCPIPDTSYHNPYYMTSETLSHGSMVAALICQMCPKARLYVARLNEMPSMSGGNRLLTADSAAQAIQWATKKNVDIICMSWTIEKNPHQNAKGIQDLEEALKKAHAANIIMLCSASDQGSGSKTNCYPRSEDNCIKIGAATESGDRCSWVHKEDASFIFPGENVPLKTGNDSPTKLYNGSSVATAIAAGSAGLLLYLNRLAAKGNGRSTSSNSLKKHAAMQNAFRTMSNVAYSSNNCPRFSHFFANKFTELTFRLDPDKFYEKLGKIMDQIKTEAAYL